MFVERSVVRRARGPIRTASSSARAARLSMVIRDSSSCPVDRVVPIVVANLLGKRRSFGLGRAYITRTLDSPDDQDDRHHPLIDTTHGDYARGRATRLWSRQRRELTGHSAAAFRSIQPQDWSLTS